MTEWPALCTNPHCRPPEHGGPRPTQHAWFCPTCFDRLRQQLGHGWTDTQGRHHPGITQMWADLQDNLARTEHATDPDQGHQKNGGKSHGTGLNEAVSDAMRACTKHVWFLTRTILDIADQLDRHIRLPTDQDTPTLAAWIADWHTDWLTTRTGRLTAATIIEDTHTIHRQVRRAAYPSGGRKVETGLPCDQHTTTTRGERTPCPGHMIAWVTPDMTHTPDLVCTEDQMHRVDPATWQRQGWKTRHATMNQTGARALAAQITR